MSLGRALRAFLASGRSAAPSAPAAEPVSDAYKLGAIPVFTVGEEPAPAPVIPPAALQIVAEFEAFRADAYLCPAHVWTIGYGTTRWGNGAPIIQGDGPITEDSARRLLKRDLAEAARAVDDLVTVALTEHQRAALISLAYNIGRGAFARSTLLMHLNAGRVDTAAGEFTRWVHGGGKVLPGLVRRRAAEVRLFSGRA
jgi:lysozyme